MQISRLDKETIQLSSDNATTVITLAAKFDGSADIITGPNLDSDLSRPGEYEYSDVTLIAAEQRPKLVGKANIFKIICEKINVGFVSEDTAKLDKQVLDMVGAIDILFVTSNLRQETFQSLVNDFDPSIVMGIDISDEQAFAHAFGITATKETKLKIKKEQLSVIEGEIKAIVI